jgi:hypothetical protein
LAVQTILTWSATAPGWFEQLGDFGDGFGTGSDVAHDGAGAAVPGLGHDELKGHALVAEVGGGRVPELVEFSPGVATEQDAGAVVAEPGAPDGGAQVFGRGPSSRARPAFGQEYRSGFAASYQPGQ